MSLWLCDTCHPHNRRGRSKKHDHKVTKCGSCFEYVTCWHKLERVEK